MAKETKEVVKSDFEKDYAKTLSDENYLEYTKQLLIRDNLKKKKFRDVDKEKIESLLNFYSNDNFTSKAKENLDIDKKRLIEAAKRTNSPELVSKLILNDWFCDEEAKEWQDLILKTDKLKSIQNTTNEINDKTTDEIKKLKKDIKVLIKSTNNQIPKKLKNTLSKNPDIAFDCATEYVIKMRKYKKVPISWCDDVVLYDIKNDLKKKNPSKSSINRISEYLYTLYTDDAQNLTEQIEFFEHEIKKRIADKVFGTDDELKKIGVRHFIKNAKRKNMRERKSAFIKNATDMIDEVREAYVVANERACFDRAFEDELQTNEKLSKAVNLLANQIYADKMQAERDKAVDSLDKIRKAHPNDYDRYIASLKKTRAYKRAYEKYSKMYAKMKEDSVTEAKDKIKNSSDYLAKGEVLNNTKGETKTSTKDNTPKEEASL